VDVHVEVLNVVSEQDADAISRLVPQVSHQVKSVSRDRINRVATDPRSCIVVARTGGQVVGTATLLTMVTLVGQFGYVEEVAVDGALRGRGIGRALMGGIVAAARDRALDFVELTSRPSREAANTLYKSIGFQVRETNVYRFDLHWITPELPVKRCRYAAGRSVATG
jgi:ribosomal protein S18 acetylase RimI-like enzyme